MRKWFLLGAAIASEVAGSLSLKGALENPLLYVVVVVGYVVAFALLSLVLRAGMPVGVAYGVWGALGVAVTALLSAIVFGEQITPLMIAGMVLVIAGVLCVNLGLGHARRKREVTS